MAERDHLSVDEFCRRSGLAPATVRRYLRSGRLPFAQPGGRKHRVLIPIEALRDLAGRATPAPPPPAPDSARKATRPGPKPRWLEGPASP